MVLLLILLLASLSDCWIFDVQLLTYNNPTSRRSSTLCCDSGCGDCDNDFDFCLRGTGSSNCIYGSYRTGLVAENDDSLTFGDIIGINSISNPLIFNGTEPPSDDQLLLQIAIYDVDTDTTAYIDGAIVTYTYSSINGSYIEQNVTGNVFTLQLRYRIGCVNDTINCNINTTTVSTTTTGVISTGQIVSTAIVSTGQIVSTAIVSTGQIVSTAIVSTGQITSTAIVSTGQITSTAIVSTGQITSTAIATSITATTTTTVPTTPTPTTTATTPTAPATATTPTATTATTTTVPSATPTTTATTVPPSDNTLVILISVLIGIVTLIAITFIVTVLVLFVRKKLHKKKSRLNKIVSNTNNIPMDDGDDPHYQLVDDVVLKNDFNISFSDTVENVAYHNHTKVGSKNDFNISFSDTVENVAYHNHTKVESKKDFNISFSDTVENVAYHNHTKVESNDLIYDEISAKTFEENDYI